MAGDDRQYPPSDLKLAQLRREGIVPKSKELGGASAIGAALLVVLLIAPARIDEVLLWLERSLATPSAIRPGGGVELAGAVAAAYLTAIGLFLVPLLVIVLLAGFLQTRFLFSLALLRMDGSRLTSGLSRFAPELGSRVVRALVGAVLLVLYLCAAMMVVRSAVERDRGIEAATERGSLAKIVETSIAGASGAGSAERSAQGSARAGTTVSAAANRDPHAYRPSAAQRSALVQVLTPWWDLGLQGLRACAALFLFVGIVARLLASVEFRRRHRMSREEIEQEARENEGPPELKRLIRDLQG